MPQMQIRLLGSFEARDAKGVPLAPPGRQSVALLACLTLPHEAPRSRQDLAALLWHGRGPEQTAASLRQELTRLRKAFGPDLLRGETSLATLPALAQDQIDVDLLRFEAAVADPGRAQEAIALYRGPLLDGIVLRDRDPFTTWLTAQRRRLDQAAAEVMLRVLRGAEASEALARRLLRFDPLCEEAWRYLIRRHAADGELGRARQTYESCARAVNTATGGPPTAETRALMQVIEEELTTSALHPFRHAEETPAALDPEWLRAAARAPQPLRPPPGPLPLIEDRPAIAVLPFRDLTRPAEADPWLALGMTEEVTNALSRMPGFFVTARLSTEAYAGLPLDARAVAADLGVRYLLEGSLERGDGRLRSNLRLIDGRSGMHLWADRVEGPIDGRMELRDAIVREIAGRLQPRLLQAEIERALRRPPAHPDAWSLTMQAAGQVHRTLAGGNQGTGANDLLLRALEIDPDYAMAHALLSALLTWQTVGHFFPRGMRTRWKARLHMEKALRLEPDNPFVLAACAETTLYSLGDIDRSIGLLEAALRRDPNDANALAMLANARRMAGDPPEGSLALIEQAMRLSPRDPRSAGWWHNAAWCHWKMGDFASMEHAARRSVEMYRLFGWSWVALSCALGLQGREVAARSAANVVRELMPGFTPLRFYITARFFYRHRFTGETREGYRRLRAVLDAAMR